MSIVRKLLTSVLYTEQCKNTHTWQTHLRIPKDNIVKISNPLENSKCLSNKSL